MRILWLTVLVGLYTADLSALTITTRITRLGSNSYRETFVIEDFTISFGQALEIRYPAALFGSLRDVRRPATKSGMLLFPLPDSIGGERIYFVQALLDQAGPVTFTLEFTYLGAGEPPGVHP